jgi:hypothetical protein
MAPYTEVEHVLNGIFPRRPLLRGSGPWIRPQRVLGDRARQAFRCRKGITSEHNDEVDSLRKRPFPPSHLNPQKRPRVAWSGLAMLCGAHRDRGSQELTKAGRAEGQSWRLYDHITHCRNEVGSYTTRWSSLHLVVELPGPPRPFPVVICH